jgi:hypothetical protein
MKLSKMSRVLLVMVLGASCKKPYNPPTIATPNSYLVVEGTIDPGNDTTVIKLSQTVNLSSGQKSIPLLGAAVSVVSETGTAFPLTASGNGYYRALLNLNSAMRYQLKITTGGKSYSSDPIQIKNAPAIDTLTYSVKSNGIQIELNAHDQTNQSRYYRWSYTETYIIHSAFSSSEVFVKTPQDTVLFRAPSQQIYQCWVSDTSGNITLGSSAKLTQDVIANQAIAFIGSSDEKLGDVYSMLVKQYVLTTDAFNYYQQLNKNTTQLGSIFDAQPSELSGNVHCTSNPAEIVIGFVTAGTYSTKRIFVDSRNLPAWLPQTPYAGCRLDTFLYKKVLKGGGIENQVEEYIYSGFDTPVAGIFPTIGGPIAGFSGSSQSCVDCTLRGTNIKPNYWPN